VSLTGVRQFVLRVNKSKLRKEQLAGDSTDLQDSDLSATPTSSLPRERPDVPDDHSHDNPVPEVYWITPQHVTMYVMEISGASSTFSVICNQQGLRTGERLSLQGQFPGHPIMLKSGTQLLKENQCFCLLNHQ
jgi:hypothetical protein